MKRRLSFTFAVLWVTALTVCGIFVILFSEKQSTVSEKENRYLAGFPEVSAESLATGEFSEGFEEFLSDNFIGRDEIIDASENMLACFNTLSEEAALESEIAYMDEAVTSAGGEALTEATEMTETEETETEEEDAYEAREPADEEELLTETDEPEENIDQDADVYNDPKYAYLWYDKKSGGRYIEYTYKKSDIATYAETLKIMQSYLPEDGNINFIQVPLASMGNLWRNNQGTYSGWGSSVESALEECLEGTERIYVYSAYKLLAPYVCAKTRMFYITDHHWTAEAAYIAASAMLERQGMPVIPYDTYTYRTFKSTDKKNGEQDRFNVPSPLYPCKSYVVNYGKQTEIELMNYSTNSYRIYMNGTKLPWRRIVTQAGTGRKALVICDSFGNDFTPYLLAYYDEVHMCDFRSDSYDKKAAGGSIGENIQRYGIDDVYIVTSTANGLRKQNSLKYLRKFLVG